MAILLASVATEDEDVMRYMESAQPAQCLAHSKHSIKVCYC